ncbi:hypothetical protein GCM10009854_13080 [Saccharopolyspora halophila]|uniref:Transposase n=1 Tax=Saccharopolyspora halophila TaxID=405551 RepID=A0ABP5SWY3_9PSEU
MAEVEVRGKRIILEVAVINAQAWLICPIAGERCGMVKAELGAIAVDCMAWHLEHAHPTL